MTLEVVPGILIGKWHQHCLKGLDVYSVYGALNRVVVAGDDWGSHIKCVWNARQFRALCQTSESKKAVLNQPSDQSTWNSSSALQTLYVSFSVNVINLIIVSGLIGLNLKETL